MVGARFLAFSFRLAKGSTSAFGPNDSNLRALSTSQGEQTRKWSGCEHQIVNFAHFGAYTRGRFRHVVLTLVVTCAFQALLALFEAGAVPNPAFVS